MAKRKPTLHRKDETPEYELAFRSRFNVIGEYIEAELRSPQLDLTMHAGGLAPVRVWTSLAGSKHRPGFILDAFHVESVLDFLRTQGVVRTTVERRLRHERRVLNLDGAGDIWDHAKVDCIYFETRPDTFGRTAKLRSAFTVVLKVDWDEEHWRMAEFTNGKFADISAE